VEAFTEVLEDADAETTRKIQDAGNKFSKHTHGPYKHALQTLDFGILEKMFMGSLFDDDYDDYDDDDDYDYDDDYDDDDFNPLNMFGGGDGMPDINDLDNPLTKSMFLEMSKYLKAEDPKQFKKMFEELLEALELFIDEQGLRGATKARLQSLKASIKEDRELGGSVAMLNLLFLKEAKKQLSWEGKALFLD